MLANVTEWTDRLQLLAAGLSASVESKDMHTLHIALQDGFSNDALTITVNELLVFDKSGVTTNLAISYADSLDVPVTEDAVVVEVAVPSKCHVAQRRVNVIETPYIAVRITGDAVLEIRPSKEKFYYL